MPIDEAPRTAIRGASPHLLDVRPCGVCQAYVPAVSGCKHWRPADGSIRGKNAEYWARKKIRDAERQRRNRAAERAAVAEFRRQQGV